MYKRPPARNVIDEDDPRVSKFGHPAPPWLVNYADLMTELVCFFIILYALSAVLSKHIQNAKKELDRIITEEKLNAKTTITKEGVRFTLEEQGTNAYFQIGKAELTEKMAHLLTKLGPLFKSLPNEIIIEGHTDNTPITTDTYPSNWELSAARSLTVLHHLIENYKIEPFRISAIGYGEFRPAGPNDTPEDRAKNRRVVFFIKNVPPQYGAEDKKKGGRHSQVKAEEMPSLPATLKELEQKTGLAPQPQEPAGSAPTESAAGTAATP